MQNSTNFLQASSGACALRLSDGRAAHSSTESPDEGPLVPFPDSPRMTVKVDMKISALPSGVELDKIAEKPKKYFEKLIAQLPKHSVSLKESVGAPPKCFEHNNYGLTADPETDIAVVDEHVQFYLKGEKQSVFSPPAYVDRHQIFACSENSIFADAVRSSDREGGFQSFVVADGCNWGKKPQLAAQTAAGLAMKVIEEQAGRLSKTTTRQIAKIHLDAFQNVQEQLVSLGENAGNTTLTIATIAGRYLVVTRLGDSDVFLLRNTSERLHCINVTAGSRSASKNGTDPGGRLGQNKGGYADWRNLAIAVVQLEPNDLIVGCSDGVYDNFDPKQLGLNPNEFGLSESEWNNQIPTHMEIRQYQLNKRFAQVAGGDVEMVAARLIEYISQLTLKTKLYMLENPTKGEPKSYEEYPGKADHASGVVCKYEPVKT